MPNPCTVCTHPDRAAIEQAMVSSAAAPQIAAQYRISDDAVLRHKAKHLPAVLAQGAAAMAQERAVTVAETAHARDAETVMQALDVVAQLKAINAATIRVLHDARAGDNPNPDLVLRAVDRVLRQIELQAKLIGQLDDRPVVNILINPQWLEIRTVLLAALAPYPDARQAVAARLVALESSN